MAAGNGRAHSSLIELESGALRMMSGYLPVVIGGYPLPFPRDADRLANADLERMPPVILGAERKALRMALVGWIEMRSIGVSQVMLPGLPPAPQIQALGEWMAARFHAMGR